MQAELRVRFDAAEDLTTNEQRQGNLSIPVEVLGAEFYDTGRLYSIKVRFNNEEFWVSDRYLSHYGERFSYSRGGEVWLETQKIKVTNPDVEKEIQNIIDSCEDEEAFKEMESLGFSNRVAEFILNS